MRFCCTISRSSRRPRGGFTLLEALMASAILGAAVVSVTSAITAGQQQAYEANLRLAAGMAAEEMHTRLALVTYAAMPFMNNYTEPVGQMKDDHLVRLPEMYNGVGRRVLVTTVTKSMPTLSVNVRGHDVRVQAFDADGVILAEVSRFMPEPGP